MNISAIGSNYYNYYQQQSQSTSKTDEASMPPMPPPPPPMEEGVEGQSATSSETSDASGDSLRDIFMQMQAQNSSMIYQLSNTEDTQGVVAVTDDGSNAEALRVQIDALVSADLESYTSEDVTDLLTELQASMADAPYLPLVASTLVETDLSTLDEAAQLELLTDLKGEATEITSGPLGMRKPQGPPPGGMGPIGAVEDSEETEASTLQEMLEELLEKLQEQSDEEATALSATLEDFLSGYTATKAV